MPSSPSLSFSSTSSNASVSTTALVLIDVFDANAREASATNKALEKLLAQARLAGVFTVFLRPVSAKGLVDSGSFATKVASSLIPQDTYSEVIVDYAGGSAFGASALPLMLRANGIQTLVIAGNDKSLDATCTARDAIARGLQVHIVEDALLSSNARLNGASIVTTAFIAEQWPAAEESATDRSWKPQAKKDQLLRTLADRIVPSHTALVIVDMQNDFCFDPRRKEGDPDSMPLVTQAAERTPALLEAAREAGVTVAHVHAEYGLRVRAPGSPWRYPSTKTFESAAFSASAAEITTDQAIPIDELELCKPGSRGAQIIDSLTPIDGEIDIRKHRFSAFVDTPLDAILKRNGIRTIVFAGVTTHCCIESTARDAAMLDYYVVIAEDCVGSKDAVRELHDTSLAVMRAYFGLVEPSQSIVDCWKQ